VWVADIAEIPTELGNKCLLLQELGFNAYRNTEEELFEALTESAQRPECLEICLKSSRCQKFLSAFEEGRTPFSERDPIRLLEHGGRYWVAEGKHRVCLAKRAGVESLEALVCHLKEDTESLLPREGEPGRYQFRSSFNFGSLDGARGTMAYLWAHGHPDAVPRMFNFRGAWLDVSQDTEGSPVELFPGLQYRVLIRREHEKKGFFRRREQLVVEAEVLIESHPKTKIWLLEMPPQRFSPGALHPSAPSTGVGAGGGGTFCNCLACGRLLLDRARSRARIPPPSPGDDPPATAAAKPLALRNLRKRHLMSAGGARVSSGGFRISGRGLSGVDRFLSEFPEKA